MHAATCTLRRFACRSVESGVGRLNGDINGCVRKASSSVQRRLPTGNRYMSLCRPRSARGDKPLITHICAVFVRGFSSARNGRDDDSTRSLTTYNSCPYPCCDLTFKSEHGLQRHFRKHDALRRFSCSHCLLRFNSKLQAHTHFIHSHSAEKPFCCLEPDCTKQFATKQGLTSHLTSHKFDKPYKCQSPGCTYAGKRPSDLKLHMISHSKDSKPHKCEYTDCHATFNTYSSLVFHERTLHLKLKPFKCEHGDCSRSFGRKYHLMEHKRIHTGEKPFVCTEPGCGQSFAIKGNMRKHVIKKHPGSNE